MRVLAILLGVIILTVAFSGMASAADSTSTVAVLIDFNNGRAEWVDVPITKGMDGYDVFLNATAMLGFGETHSPTPPYGHTIQSIDGYTGNYNFSNPSSPYDFWRLLKWESATNKWVFSGTLVDGIDPFSTRAIGLMYTRYPYMGPPLSTPDQRDTWITGRNDFYNTAYDRSYNASSVELSWTKDLGNGAVDSPVIAAAGRLYAVTTGLGSEGAYTTNARLFCLSGSGDTIWSANMGMGHHTAAPLLWNGVVYAPSADGNLYAFNAATGAQKWTYAVGTASGGITSSPVMYQNNIIVAGAGGNIVAVNQNGGRVWSTTLSTTIASAPALFDGVLYIGGGDGSLHAVVADGKGQRWAVPIGGSVTGSPVIGNDQVYVTYAGPGGTGGGVAAVSMDGALLWKTETGATPGSASLTPDGVVSVSPQGLSLVGENGAQQWTADLRTTAVGGSPVSVANMTYVITGGSPGRLLAVDPRGGVAWTETMAGTVIGSPSIANNSLYVPFSGGLSAYRFTDLKVSAEPVAAFKFSFEDKTVKFDASSSSGGEGELTYSWDFGDGATDQGAKVQHTYQSGGNHTVNLVVADTTGASSNLTRVVNLDAPPAPDPGDPDGPSGGGTGPNVRGEFPIWLIGLAALAVIAGVTVYLRRSKRKR
jgi:outer membrane protein assembly factor BamB